MIPETGEVPERPGVYVFKDQRERPLYVGKAKNLRKRLRTYFQDSANLEPRKAAMVRMTRDVATIVTDNELEALVLEANLIKQYKPRFNIILRDDKNYPYIKLTLTEEWPRIEVVRRIAKDGNSYFGPYVPAQGMWEAIAFIRRNFSVRTCGYLLDKPMRPCIQYQMKRCSAPCAGKISKDEYMKIVGEVKLFLMGEKQELIESLEERMLKLSEELRFEEAAALRDRIVRLRRAFESQKVIAPELGDLDVIGFYRGDGQMDRYVAFHILFVRNGVLIGAKNFFTESIMAPADAEIMHSFMELFYTKDIFPPATIATNVVPDEIEALTTMLEGKRGARVVIEVPVEGKKQELLMMANENARLGLQSRRKTSGREDAGALKDKVKLRHTPVSIGAFDVSTIQGTDSVGAFVFWEEGEFKKSLYRRVRIRGVQGVDDYSMMKETVERTLKNLQGKTPDLLVIDGGKGQLEVARKVMREAGITAEVVGVAKKPDRAFLCNDEVVDLEDKSRASLLLKRIRDEVHRFAISFHRKLRDKRLVESPLEQIHGIGKKRRLELLRHFGGIAGLRAATVEDLVKLKGFNRSLAERVLAGIKGSQGNTISTKGAE